jgi:hypothetical protein
MNSARRLGLFSGKIAPFVDLSPNKTGAPESLRILNARSTFAGLQVLDVLTTLAAFHVGAFEINPIVARLTVLFGRFNGVLLSKLIALLLALGVRKRLWIVNLFYIGVVCWNLIVLVSLSGHK